ncbi:hypothetical protein BC332_34916 [Capsicum chinense]|nr:hypothetical protein BC332_34916 [Capsicum chinense]
MRTLVLLGISIMSQPFDLRPLVPRSRSRLQRPHCPRCPYTVPAVPMLSPTPTSQSWGKHYVVFSGQVSAPAVRALSFGISGVACFAIYRLICFFNLWKRIDTQGVRHEHLNNRFCTTASSIREMSIFDHSRLATTVQNTALLRKNTE